jgi:hypothetical protein
MKIIFLDFDGVLNNFTSHRLCTGDTFSAVACENLNKILEAVPEAKIVVSSAWRMWGLKRIKEILAKNGIDETKVIDITGDEKGFRGYQIQCWMDRNPGVTNLVILDDDSDMCELMNKLVKTNSFIGLTETGAKQAIKVLKAPLKG